MIFKYKTIENQNWFDLSLQLYGTSDRAYELANLNNYSILNNPLPNIEINYETDTNEVLRNGFNNQNNNIFATSPNSFLSANSFSDDFNLNEFF